MIKQVFSSGLITQAESPVVVCNRDCLLMAVHVYSDGVNMATVTVYDNASSPSGLVLAKLVCKGEDLQIGEGNIRARARNGLTVAISGSGASALIRYAGISPGV